MVFEVNINFATEYTEKQPENDKYRKTYGAVDPAVFLSIPWLN
jgi:hypothetical protein